MSALAVNGPRGKYLVIAARAEEYEPEARSSGARHRAGAQRGYHAEARGWQRPIPCSRLKAGTPLRTDENCAVPLVITKEVKGHERLLVLVR